MESRVEEIMDSRLSSLPDDIIHNILSTVSMKDVVKTSVLSSRWRYIWTSVPCLNFSTEELFSKRVTGVFPQALKHVLSHRNNQVPMSCVKINNNFGMVSPKGIEKILEYILSHNVQQVDVECRFWGNYWSHEWDDDYLSHKWHDDSDLIATHFSSLKQLSLTSTDVDCPEYLTASSNLVLPALTTLYLSRVELYGDNDTLFSKCLNLKNLTLKGCKMKGLDSFSICHHRLSNLTLEHDMDSVKVVNVVAPQLDNLTIRYCFEERHRNTPYYRDCLRRYGYKHLISAPNLITLTYEGYDPLPFSTDGFHALEKVDLCICSISQEAAEALEIVRLFQQIQSVKFLSLNLELLELLSSNVQVISHQPSPFVNLKTLDIIYPKLINVWETPEEIINISTEVKSYLLDSSQGAIFTMVSREEARADMNATQLMAEIQRDLARVKEIIETNLEQPTKSEDDHNGEPETQMQLPIRDITQQVRSCWKDYRDLMRRGNQIINILTSRLEQIESHLTELPASKRAMVQPCFSSLCAEINISVSKMTEHINIHGSKILNNASDRFHELATLQSSS